MQSRFSDPKTATFSSHYGGVGGGVGGGRGWGEGLGGRGWGEGLGGGRGGGLGGRIFPRFRFLFHSNNSLIDRF